MYHFPSYFYTLVILKDFHFISKDLYAAGHFSQLSSVPAFSFISLICVPDEISLTTVVWCT